MKVKFMKKTRKSTRKKVLEQKWEGRITGIEKLTKYISERLDASQWSVAQDNNYE